ncbi:dickkopf-related protein 3 [Nematostella vectensis]|uniref:dickkopf-related protein 3 n=1 Tax=Nematostella vectensis TaxID=45351 RepID=UPI002077426A|nr:dickkopf-related protein 3 [Nematostella vectensis]
MAISILFILALISIVQSFGFTRIYKDQADRRHNLFKRLEREIANSGKRASESGEPGLQRGERERKRQMIAPGYYQAECSEKKPCKAGKYCNLLYCEDCHKHKMACYHRNQCCSGMVCTYGRCEKTSKGDPGSFCEKDTDCKGDACCVLEPTVNSVIPICKPKLDEYHQCASILYRKIWVGEKPDCGPCKKGLECTQKGILASHEICMKPQKK